MRPTIRLAAGLAGALVAAYVAVCTAERTGRWRDLVPPAARGPVPPRATGRMDVPEGGGQEILAAHNLVRRKAGVAPLRWSVGLASLAQSRALQLAVDCTLGHGSLPDGIGENQLRAGPGRGEPERPALPMPLDPSEVVAAWAAEAAAFDPAANRCAPGRECGHYTQLIWATTEEVGCAAAPCPSGGQVWVCDYRPGGNIVGTRPF